MACHIHALPPLLPASEYRQPVSQCAPLPNITEDCDGRGPRLSLALRNTPELFATDQFALESLVYHRFIACDDTIKGLHLVPYPVSDILVALSEGRVNSTAAIKHYEHVKSLVRASRAWQRCGGCDHVLALSRTNLDYPIGPFGEIIGSKASMGGQLGFRLDDPFFAHVCKLSIEVGPNIHSIVRIKRTLAALRGVSNLHAVPYPTFLHARAARDVWAWQAFVARRRRAHMLVLASGWRPGVRQTLMQQCEESTNCTLVSCGGRLNSSHVHSTTIPPAACSAQALVNLYLEASYCLHPPGDTPTRKGLFDSMVAGCIPVVLHPQSLAYPAFNLSSAHVLVKSTSSISQILAVLMSGDERSRTETMRSRVIAAIPSLVYRWSMPGVTAANGSGDQWTDALTVGLQACKLARN